MPELPEVETVKNGLIKILEPNDKIKAVIIRNHRLRSPVSKVLSQKLIGHSIQNIKRRAKFIILDCGEYSILSHLGMTGSWRQLKSTDLKKHDHIILQFHSNLKLAYNDPRRFGLFEVVLSKELLENSWVAHLGIEPFDAKFCGEYLFNKAKGKSVCVKNYIMDQKIVVGVGNIYASEVLFRSQIHPLRSVSNISHLEFSSLCEEIRIVLKQAIDAGGSTIRDFGKASGGEGYFQQQLLVYGKDGEPCPVCAFEILSDFIGQRNSYWCPQCQN